MCVNNISLLFFPNKPICSNFRNEDYKAQDNNMIRNHLRKL